jgi:hypothetical protein
MDYMKRYAADLSQKRPFIMCEYAHAMGNSTGNFQEYFDVIKFPKKTHLSISAVKKLSTQSDIMLTPSVAALQIRLRPLADGQLRGVVIESIGPESSKMILTDDSSESGLVGVSAVVEE